MKKAISLLLAAALLLALCAGCAGEGPETPKETSYSASQIAAAIIAGQEEPPELYFVTGADSVFASYAALYVGAALAGRVVSGAICYPVGPLASEVTVLEFASEADAGAAPAPMAEYLDARAAAFYGYAPEESELAENGQIRVLGRFAVLWILRDQDAADRALDAAFSADPPVPPALSDYAAPLSELEDPEGDAGKTTAAPDTPDAPPADASDGPGDPSSGPDAPTGASDGPAAPADTEVPDAYDHDAVLAALREGDPAGLSPKNGAVYTAVSGILREIVSPELTDYEKELAVNDYLVVHGEYDPAELSQGPAGAPDPDNANPYGLLVHGVGICLGYAATFQLMMDVLGIECLTVHGFAHGWTEDHAWNLVRLDGDWYAVDVTWNDPVFTGGWKPSRQDLLRYYAHEYFNVTSVYLRRTEHYWREDVPEATGTKWAYRG